MAEPLEHVGGQLPQAEDELAAINMSIGTAFGGVPAFTATSEPVLALMTESTGLAVASETHLLRYSTRCAVDPPLAFQLNQKRAT
jgi:2-oxoglutarate ferredoxin oxidoreductase subunit alpha